MKEKEDTFLNNLSNERLTEIKNEINGDIRIYLNNCKESYLEYTTAAQKLFPEIYEQMKKFDSEFNFSEYLTKLDKAKEINDSETIFELLQEGISNNIYTPATYYRITLIYEKNGQLEKARNVCLSWFENDFWKLPNTWKGSLKILNKLEKIEKKYVAQHRL